MSRADAKPGGDDFRQIFLNDIPLIDTRAPVEFAKGAFPTSVSLPLMTDDERAQVGTCYKQQGQDEAIKLGHSLVCGEVKDERVSRWTEFASANPHGYLYCWRGGLRSQICQQWMVEAGSPFPRIGGGYKAMRRYLIDEYERMCRERPMVLLGGRTGCNKTEFIGEFAQSVDLEGLANHLGSSFGRRPGGQPTQLSFENALAVALLKAEDRVPDPAIPVLLEDEGRLIGRCSLPLDLTRVMQQAPLVLLEVPLEERLEHTYRNYILSKLAEWQATLGDEAGFKAFADDLTQSLARVRKRLGGVTHHAINEQLQQALAAHQQGNTEWHLQWIERLLVDYYDPMYDYQIRKRSELIIFRGDRAAVCEFLHQYHV